MTQQQFREIGNAISSQPGGYFINGIDSRDEAYLKHMYTACVRAVDYLTSLPDWDGKNVIAQGGSQGGALSIITAALDKRVTLCVANHPALSDMAASVAGRTEGYPHLSRSKFRFTPERVRQLAYFDVVNFARRVSCPTYMTWGYNDDVCPPTTSYTVWNLLTCEKESLLTPINEHWTSADTDRQQMVWIKGRLK